MTLPSDICRCHDDQCAYRTQCARWVFRSSGRVHADTLHDGEPTCGNFIDADEYETPTNTK